jgi:hypothetical protein
LLLLLLFIDDFRFGLLTQHCRCRDVGLIYDYWGVRLCRTAALRDAFTSPESFDVAVKAVKEGREDDRASRSRVAQAGARSSKVQKARSASAVPVAPAVASVASVASGGEVEEEKVIGEAASSRKGVKRLPPVLREKDEKADGGTSWAKQWAEFIDVNETDVVQHCEDGAKASGAGDALVDIGASVASAPVRTDVGTASGAAVDRDSSAKRARVAAGRSKQVRFSDSESGEEVEEVARPQQQQQQHRADVAHVSLSSAPAVAASVKPSISSSVHHRRAFSSLVRTLPWFSFSLLLWLLVVVYVALMCVCVRY